MDISNLITTKQASEIMGVSDGYVRRLMREQQLHGYAIPGSRQRLIRRSDAERFEKRGRGPARKKPKT